MTITGRHTRRPHARFILCFLATAFTSVSTASGQAGPWTITPASNCVSGSNCLIVPTDNDCDCDPDPGGASAQCTVTHSNVRVLSAGTPTMVGTGSIDCDNCGLCGCDVADGTKVCTESFTYSLNSSVTAEQLSSSLQGTLGVPGIASIAGTINSTLPLHTTGGTQATSGTCSISSGPCDHLTVQNIHFIARMGERFEVDHEWELRSVWTTDNCIFNPGGCPISGNIWITNCQDFSVTIAKANVLEAGIDCGDTTSHDCP